MKTHLCQLYISLDDGRTIEIPCRLLLYYYLFSITYNYFHSYSTPLHLLSFMIFSSSLLTFSFLSYFS
jgi:hypothetical protein